MEDLTYGVLTMGLGIGAFGCLYWLKNTLVKNKFERFDNSEEFDAQLPTEEDALKAKEDYEKHIIDESYPKITTQSVSGSYPLPKKHTKTANVLKKRREDTRTFYVEAPYETEEDNTVFISAVVAANLASQEEVFVPGGGSFDGGGASDSWAEPEKTSSYVTQSSSYESKSSSYDEPSHSYGSSESSYSYSSSDSSSSYSSSDSSSSSSSDW